MTAVPFDTLKLARALRQASFTNEQAEGAAEAIAGALQADLATKGDLAEVRAELKGDIAELKAELKGDIAELKAELKGDIAGLKAELKGDIAEVRSELREQGVRLDAKIEALRLEIAVQISAAKADIIKWMFGTIGFQTIVILGAVMALLRLARP